MSKECLSKFKPRQKIDTRWKKGQATWAEYCDVVRVCKNAMRKAKAHLELIRPRTSRITKGLFPIHQGQKVKCEPVSVLNRNHCKRGWRKSRDTECHLGFSLHRRPALKNPWPRNKVWRKKDFPLVEEDWLRDCLGKPDIHKSMALMGVAWILEGAGRHRSWATYNHLWKIVVIRRGAWGLEESKHHFGLQNGQKGGPKELTGQSSLTPVPGKVMEWLIMDTISGHLVKDK